MTELLTNYTHVEAAASAIANYAYGAHLVDWLAIVAVYIYIVYVVQSTTIRRSK